jgi:hypothetical protein
MIAEDGLARRRKRSRSLDDTGRAFAIPRSFERILVFFRVPRWVIMIPPRSFSGLHTPYMNTTITTSETPPRQGPEL